MKTLVANLSGLALVVVAGGMLAAATLAAGGGNGHGGGGGGGGSGGGGTECPDVWDPVICSNGQVYSNYCYASKAKATGCISFGDDI